MFLSGDSIRTYLLNCFIIGTNVKRYRFSVEEEKVEEKTIKNKNPSFKVQNWQIPL